MLHEFGNRFRLRSIEDGRFKCAEFQQTKCEVSKLKLTQAPDICLGSRDTERLAAPELLSTMFVIALQRIWTNNENRRCQNDCLQPGTQFRNAEDCDRRRNIRSWRCYVKRPRTRGRKLSLRPCHSSLDRTRCAPDRRHLAIPLQGRVLAPWPRHDERDFRG